MVVASLKKLETCLMWNLLFHQNPLGWKTAEEIRKTDSWFRGMLHLQQFVFSSDFANLGKYFDSLLKKKLVNRSWHKYYSDKYKTTFKKRIWRLKDSASVAHLFVDSALYLDLQNNTYDFMKTLEESGFFKRISDAEPLPPEHLNVNEAWPVIMSVFIPVMQKKHLKDLYLKICAKQHSLMNELKLKKIPIPSAKEVKKYVAEHTCDVSKLMEEAMQNEG